MEERERERARETGKERERQIDRKKERYGVRELQDSAKEENVFFLSPDCHCFAAEAFKFSGMPCRHIDYVYRWQAVYLDVVLIFPQLLRSIVGPTNQFIPQGLAETCANTVFYTILFSVVYSVFSNIVGKTPNEIPLISEAVDSQMPF